MLDFAMRSGELDDVRRQVVPRARGVVLEIGAGSGANFPFYTSDVSALVAVDPSRELMDMARSRAKALPFPSILVIGSADRLPLRDRSVDTLVITFTLCSIGAPAGALEEMRRVLKPGACLVFAEHGLSPDGRVRSWQNRLTPIWRRVAGGCHLNRKMDDLIRSAGFTIASLETRYIAGPRFATYIYTGTATPS